jgi:ABC-type sugar transport system substrate-binding protein
MSRETNMSAIKSAATLSRPILLVALASAVLLAMALTIGLWAYYGTTVFFEMVRAGWAACF